MQINTDILYIDNEINYKSVKICVILW